MKRCPTCKAADVRPSEDRRTITVQLRSGPLFIVVTGLQGERCGACGEGFLTSDELARADLLAATELADRGLREGAALRCMRKALGFRAGDLAALLDVTEGTLSRWESDHAPVDRPTWATLAAMVSEQLSGQTATLNRLRASRQPREPHGPVRLRLPEVLGARAPDQG